MACEVINSWTFIGLLGAFLNLFIAYILLCGSSVAYLASKILGFFGLSLPCPCNGIFGYPNENLCVQAMLVNHPLLKISSVQSSAMKRFPFESIWDGLYRGGGGGGVGEEEEEDGSRSQSNSEKWRNGGEASSSSWHEKKNVENGRFGSNPKGPCSYHRRPRVGLRNRSSASVGCKLGTPASTNSVNSEDGKESSKEFGLLKQGSSGFEIDDDPFSVAKKELASVESQCDGHKNVIRVLERALDKEHAGCAALYLELEKERIAASTAADEAMAMILRLQEEKATIEMEAKQYLRMIEEKAAFDEEEMNILKENLLRREREKLFLEKEVEAYKKMFFDKDQLYADIYDAAAVQEQMISNVGPLLMLEQIPQSVGQKCEFTSIVSPNRSLDFGKELLIPRLSEVPSRSYHEIYQAFEKGMTSKDKNINLVGEEIIRPLVDSGIIVRNVLDVHIINEDSKNKRDNKSITSNSPKTCDYPTSGGSETEPWRKRNTSDRSSGLPPIAPSRVKSLPPISRRNSMSAFDYEMFKIDNEVGLLRERLRIIQQGREKLNIPAGPKEREQSQMQMMENIASQLQEIRQLSVPQKALRQASLPSPSSKVPERTELLSITLQITTTSTDEFRVRCYAMVI
ncbi:Ankyrin repeat-containing protein, putative isoform 1 [Hibiscus syriacus]|uniref:Ankyrin repeat-containing protein, putative isoform 1 n=1 Tax=Hibiscus syriacus TaxID=106335 RepID=A0A6A3BRQ1_HIBSY|nr:Ankyrin repeat-containing protein, putative isoform 1 [Hibiscus syriacus]